MGGQKRQRNPHFMIILSLLRISSSFIVDFILILLLLGWEEEFWASLGSFCIFHAWVFLLQPLLSHSLHKPIHMCTFLHKSILHWIPILGGELPTFCTFLNTPLASPLTASIFATSFFAFFPILLMADRFFLKLRLGLFAHIYVCILPSSSIGGDLVLFETEDPTVFILRLQMCDSQHWGLLTLPMHFHGASGFCFLMSLPLDLNYEALQSYKPTLI